MSYCLASSGLRPVDLNTLLKDSDSGREPCGLKHVFLLSQSGAIPLWVEKCLYAIEIRGYAPAD